MSQHGFLRGELVQARSRVHVWDRDLAEACDVVSVGELATVVEDEDEYGWVGILTGRGCVGLLHRNNLLQI